MKKIAMLLIVLMLFCITAMAQDDPYASLSDVECLLDGVIRVHEDTTLNDFIETMSIIDESDDKINTDKFVFLLQQIETYYYIPVTVYDVFEDFKAQNPYVDTKDMDAVYSALFDVLDKHSYYIPPSLEEAFWNPMQDKGIGITLVPDTTGEVWGSVGTFIEGISKGSVAEISGIQVGDKLVKIFDIDVSTMDIAGISNILSAIYAQDTPSIELTIERINGNTLEVLSYDIERSETVFREYTFFLYPEKKAFVLSLSRFSNLNTPAEIIERMKELKNLGYNNAILDLRNNAGGNVQVAAGVIGAFLDEYTQLFTLSRDGYIDYYSFVSTGVGVKFKNVYVLVNEKTASSAEITAQSLNQLAGAQIIGKKTYGKGVAQNAINLADGSTFAITTFVTYDNKGKTYNEKGIIPRFVLDNEKVNLFPTDLEHFNYINYVKATKDAENEVVLALERRLELMGFLSSEFVDSKWDSYTTNAVRALQFTEGFEMTGVLSPELVHAITEIINGYKTIETTIDRQLEFALSLIID